MNFFEGQYWLIDYRKNTLEFKPPICIMRFVKPAGTGTPLIGVFIDEAALRGIDTVLGIVDEIKEPALVRFYAQNKTANPCIDAFVSFRIRDLPIYKAAKALRLGSLEEKEFESIDFLFQSGAQSRIVDHRFFEIFYKEKQECHIAFLDESFKNERLKSDALTLVPAEVNLQPSPCRIVLF